MTCQGEIIQVATSERLLGAQMCFNRRSAAHKDLKQRHKQAGEALDRIQSLPLPLEAKGALVEATVIPKLLFDTVVAPLSRRSLKNWRSRICRAIWGNAHSERCLELVLTLFCRGHAVDPLQASACRVIKASRRLLKRFPERQGQVSRALAQRLQAHGPFHGPADRLRQAV